MLDWFQERERDAILMDTDTDAAPGTTGVEEDH